MPIMHCSKANHPQHSAKDYCNDKKKKNTANEEATASQQCLQEDEIRGPCWHPDCTAFQFDFTLFSLGSRKWSEVQQEILIWRSKSSVSGVVLSTLKCFMSSYRCLVCVFVFFFWRASLYSYTSLISVSTKKGNNKMKRWQCFKK